MQEDRTPKVFISYSWSSDELVVPLAQRLVSPGVDVVLDKWDLKEGQDKYVFMEQCVSDPDITKVLIVCDKSYAEKANARVGGVGDETAIISSEVYGKTKQEKFIPIIAERDDNGDPFVPAYIKARIYIDLSNEDTYEEQYEKLLRNIYDKPLYSKPKLGKRPDWLDEEKTNLFPATDLIRQIKGATTEKKQRSCVTKFVEEYINTLKTYFVQGIKGGQEIYERFLEMKPVRDVFLDFVVALGDSDLPFSDVMCDAFEQMYNTLTNGSRFNPKSHSTSSNDYEIYKILIWELFICTIAYLRHVQDYKAINEMVGNTYFLVDDSYNSGVSAQNYCTFRHHSSPVEECYKPTTEDKNKFTLLGNTICMEREKLPIFTSEAIAEADTFLYQIRNAFELVEKETRYRDSYWFPTLYVYCKVWPSEWKRLCSRKFCQKMHDLFGVDTVDALKEKVSKCTYEKEMRYNGSFDAAPGILSMIKLDDIGSVN